MKTVDHLVIVIAAVLYAASCSVAEAPEIVVLPSECPVFEASIEDDADTKVFADSHLKILWHADDRISIFNKNTYNNQYKFDGETGDNAGSFTHIPNNTFVTGNALDNVYAVYPYSEKSSISNSGVLKVELPAKQSYAAGSFGRGANAMVAVTGDNMLIFKNVCGYFLFQLYGKDLFVSSISLKATGGEALAGVANVTVDSEGVPSAELVSETSSEVVLECDPPQPLGPGEDSVTSFWFALPPVTFSQGFSIVVTLSDGRTFEKSLSTEIPIVRNRRSRMAPLEIVPDGEPAGTPWAVDLGLSVNWASFNVGAKKPEEYGYFISWGETEPKSEYSWNTNKWGYEDDGIYITKYNYEVDLGTIDNKMILEPGDDAARANWGEDWRMPTPGEVLELIENCTLEKETLNGVYGFRLTSKKEGFTNASVFFPASGYMSGITHKNATLCGYFWTSAVSATEALSGTMIVLGDEQFFWRFRRFVGAPIRPVTDSDRRIPVTGISLDQSSLAFTEGEKGKLNATIMSYNASQPVVLWTSSDNDIATVSNKGEVTALTEGSVDIIATTLDGQFSASCQVTVTAKGYVPVQDAVFKEFLLEFFDNNENGEISIGEAEQATTMRFSTKNISSLSGIEYFVNLTDLCCYGARDPETKESIGKLTSLDLSHNTKLKYLDCGYNKLTSLDLSACQELETCYCGYQDITSVNLAQNSALVKFHGPFNKMTGIDVSKNTALAFLDCGGNNLTSLDVSSNAALTDLYCGYNKLTALDLSNNPNLTLIHCLDNPGLKEIWLSSSQKLKKFDYDNKSIILYYKENSVNHPLAGLFGSYTASAKTYLGEDKSWPLIISMDKTGHSTVRVYNIAPCCGYSFWGDCSYVGTVSEDKKTITIACGQTSLTYEGNDSNNVLMLNTWSEESEGSGTVQTSDTGNIVFTADDEGVWHSDDNILLLPVVSKTPYDYFVTKAQTWTKNNTAKAMMWNGPVRSTPEQYGRDSESYYEPERNRPGSAGKRGHGIAYTEAIAIE